MNIKKYVKVSLIMLLLIITVLLTSCANNKNKNKIVVSEVAHSIFYAPFYVALNNGYFDEVGLEVEVVLGNGANNVMASLLSKDAHIGLAGAEATIYVYNQGQKDYAINFCQLTQRDGNFLVSRTKIDDFNYDMLKGKEILGGRKGGMPEMVLEYVLRKKGLNVMQDNKQVLKTGGVNVRTDVQFASLAGAFTSGEGDYVTLFEPTATLIENEKKGYIVSSLGMDSGLIPYTNFFANKSFIKNNKDKIQGFTNAIVKGVNYVYSASAIDVANAIKPYFTSSTIDEIVIVINRYLSIEAWAKSPVLDKEGYELFLDIMDDANELSNRVMYDLIVDTSFAKNCLN